MTSIKKTFIILISFFFISVYSQNKKDELRGEFTYLLKAKLNRLSKDVITNEFFTLQITDDKAFFVSENTIKFDSVFQKEFQNFANNTSANKNSNKIIDFKGKFFPKTKFPFIIIQSPENIQYFENVAMVLLSYNEPLVKDWKLINQSTTINTFNCKKAEINFKGRNWVAWYSEEIPFPYGPYKFSGLSGLIIKISDDNGDYEFELVNSLSSSQMNNRYLNINKNRYTKATETTQKELENVRKNFNDNLVQRFESMGTVFKPEQRENLIKEQTNQKINENPIELEN